MPKFLDLQGLGVLKECLDKKIKENTPTIINMSFEVDEDGNLVAVTPNEEPVPEGFSIDEEGYLIYDDGK